MNIKYYSLLDVLRFLAAVFVMLFHYYSGSLQNINIPPDSILHNLQILLYTLVNHGYLGVELFFIISGFVIYNSLKNKKDTNGNTIDKLDIKAYAWSRFIRLYPLFWILCTITYIMTIFMASSHLPFYKYLLNLFIINNGQTANMIDGSYWTLTIEILFYIYIGLFAYVAGRKNIIYFFALWLGYSFISYTFGFSELLISKLLLVRYAPYFVYGGTLAILIQYILNFNYFVKEKRQHLFNLTKSYFTLSKKASLFNFLEIKNKIRVLEGFFLPICLMIASIYMTKYISNHLIAINEARVMTNKFGIFNGLNQTLIYYIFAIATLFTFLSLYIENKTLIKYLQILGLATYPLYLMHQRMGSMIIELYTDFGVIDIYSVSITIVIVLIAIYVGVLDKDMRKYITRMYLMLPWGSSAKR